MTLGFHRVFLFAISENKTKTKTKKKKKTKTKTKTKAAKIRNVHSLKTMNFCIFDFKTLQLLQDGCIKVDT